MPGEELPPHYEFSQVFYRYQPLVADADVNTWLNTITAGQVDVPLGLRQMQAQVNEVETTATPAPSLQQTIAAQRQTQRRLQGMFAAAGAPDPAAGDAPDGRDVLTSGQPLADGPPGGGAVPAAPEWR